MEPRDSSKKAQFDGKIITKVSSNDSADSSPKSVNSKNQEDNTDLKKRPADLLNNSNGNILMRMKSSYSQRPENEVGLPMNSFLSNQDDNNDNVDNIDFLSNLVSNKARKSSRLDNSWFKTRPSMIGYTNDQIGDRCIKNSNLNPSENDLAVMNEEMNIYNDFYSKIRNNNKKYIDEKLSQDPLFFIKISAPQKPKCLAITCSDSRIAVNECMGLEPGELFVHRNIGNLVLSTDFNVQSVIQYAVQVLKVEHIMILGHTDCGAAKAALSSKNHGLIDHWLRTIREVAEKYQYLLEEENEHLDIKNIKDTGCCPKILRRLIELVIKEQVLSVCKSPVVQKAWNDGQVLFVHGHIVELDTGKLIDLEINQDEWQEIEGIYRFDFDK